MTSNLQNRGVFSSPGTFSSEHLPLYCELAGIIESNPRFLIDRVYYPGYVVMFVAEGKFFAEQFDILHRMQAGDVMLMDLHEKHRYGSDPDDPCRLLWFHFTGRTAREIFSLVHDAAGPLLHVEDHWLPDRLEEIVTTYREGGTSRFYTTSILAYEVLIRMIQISDTGDRTLSDPRAEELVKTVTRYIETHMDSAIALKELAGAVNLSIYHFSRYFKACTGTSPMAYVLLKKIEKARYELLYSSKSIGQIAASLGFSDQSHLWRTFRQITGMSPGMLRKRST